MKQDFILLLKSNCINRTMQFALHYSCCAKRKSAKKRKPQQHAKYS